MTAPRHALIVSPRTITSRHCRMTAFRFLQLHVRGFIDVDIQESNHTRARLTHWMLLILTVWNSIFESLGDHEKTGEGWEGGGKEAASCPCSWSLVGATGKGRGFSATVSVEREAEWEREREKREKNERGGAFSQHRYACLPHFQSRHRCYYLWVEITAEVCSVSVCFKYQSPCALPSSSQLTAVCCDLTAKDQTGAETRASGLGRVLKERQEPRGKKKRRKTSRRTEGTAINKKFKVSFPQFSTRQVTQ